MTNTLFNFRRWTNLAISFQPKNTIVRNQKIQYEIESYRGSHTARFYSIHLPRKSFVESFKSPIFASDKQINTLYENTLFLRDTVATAIFTGYNSRGTVAEEISDDGLLLNTDLIAVCTDDGKVSIKNATTGKVTINKNNHL